MDPSQYYLTTLSAAFKNIAPILGFILVGYVVFIKLPFLFFLKSMREERVPEQNDFRRVNDTRERDYKLEDYLDFQRRMKIIGNPKTETAKEETKREEPKREYTKKTETKFEKAKAESRDQKKEEPRQEKKKTSPPPKSRNVDPSAEEIFEISPGSVFSKSDLKKKYHELLKMNHPDKVASMGPELKKLAEKKTKEINSAYVKLKARAA